MGSSSHTRRWTQAACLGSSVSQPLDHYRSPYSHFFILIFQEHVCQIIGCCLTNPWRTIHFSPIFFLVFFWLENVYCYTFKVSNSSSTPLNLLLILANEFSIWGTVLCIVRICNFFIDFMSLLRFPFLFFFNWRKIVLQSCVGFYHTTTQTSHNYTYTPSLLSLPPLPSPHTYHRAPGWTPCVI